MRSRRRRMMIEYGLVIVAVIATVAVILVVSRVDQVRLDQQGAAPVPTTVTTTVPGTGISTGSPTTVSATATSAPSSPSTTTRKPTAPAPTKTTNPPRTTTAPAPPPVPPSLLGKDIERIPTSQKVVALTFDAGSNADGLAAILDTLRREGVRATFFLTGNFAKDFAGQSAQIVAAGHRVGNHSVTHPYFTKLSDDGIRTQLSGAEQAILATTGRNPRPLFRFPYGDRDQRTIRVVNDSGYAAIRWTVDSFGWKGTLKGGMTATSVTARVLGALQPGEIVLMHVGSNPDDHTTLDAAALPSIISQIRAAGYTFVTLDALLN